MSEARILKIPINNWEEKNGPRVLSARNKFFFFFYRNKKTLRESRKLKKDFHTKKPETIV